MRPLSRNCLILISFFSLSTAAVAETDNNSTFGLQTAVSDDGVQAGAIVSLEKWEAVISIDGSALNLKKSDVGTGQTGDTGIKMRAGRRTNIDDQDFFSYGLSYYRTFFGRDNGVSTDGTYKLGAYIGLERKFAHTPIMLFSWVEPYAIGTAVGDSGDGATSKSKSGYQILQRGGFGMAYYF